VHGTTGAAGGYRLGAGAALPPLLLDDDEAVAVAVGLRTAAGGTVAGIEETSVRALAKLEQVMPSRLRHRVSGLQTAMVPVTGVGPTVRADVLTAIAGSCRDHQRLRFDYHNRDGVDSVRTVEPHRLVCWGRRWYLVAWDVDRQDWRTFRVDRIEPRIPTGPRFTPRELPGGDVAAYVSQRVSYEVWTHQARVLLHAPVDTVADRIPPTAGLLEAVDEHSCMLDTGANRLDLLALHLGMLNVDFEVRDPPELVEHIRALADRYRKSVP
jgi:predicted DNA-binding transcriptional regulator YafY